MTLDEGHGPYRQEQARCELGVRIGRFSPYAFRERYGYNLREFIAYRPGPCLEGFTALDRLYKGLAPGGKFEERALFLCEPMRKQA